MLKEYQYHTCTYTYIYIHTSHRCYKSIAKWVGAVKVPIPLPRIRVHIHLHTYITQVLQEYRKMGWCWKSTNTITTHTRTHTSTTYIHHTGAASVSQNGLVLEKYQYHYHTYMYTYIYIHTSHRCCKSITKWVGAGRVPRPLPHTHAHAHPHTTQVPQEYHKMGWCWKSTKTITTHTRTRTFTYIHHTGAARESQECQVKQCHSHSNTYFFCIHCETQIVASHDFNGNGSAFASKQLLRTFPSKIDSFFSVVWIVCIFGFFLICIQNLSIFILRGKFSQQSQQRSLADLASFSLTLDFSDSFSL